MRCGFFNDPGKEYVVTTPFTPVKWINYVGTLRFGGIIDHTGGILLCKGDPALNRITKYIAQMPSSDFKGSTIYIRIKGADGKYFIYSPFYTPTLIDLEKYECHVGLSYNTYVAEAFGIRSEITIFASSEDQVLIQDIKITNIGGDAKEIDIIPVVEFSHFDALKQLTNADWVPQTMTLRGHRDKDGIILEQYAFMKHENAVNYFTATIPASSFEGDRKKFLGNNEYGSWAKPLSLFSAELGNSECVRGDNIAALMIHLGSVKPNDTKRFATLMGQEWSIQEAKPKIDKYRMIENIDRAFSELAVFWNEYLSTLQINTPDEAFNTMVNVHNPRQCHTTKNWSRDLSLYQLGFGGRGMGYRDSSQDVLGVMPNMPKEAIELVEKILSVQRRDGSGMHQFYPLTMEASIGDSHEKADRPNYYGDDHLWPVFSVAAYIKETGDFEFLDKVLPFYDKDDKRKTIENGSVWEHLIRAIEFTEKNKGRHGLPLLGFADWNDTVNLPTGAESLFVANQFGKALLDMIDLCAIKNDDKLKARFKGYYDTMKKAVEETGWDGEWYVRYFDHKGNPIGTHKNEKGKIWINSQTWAIISGIASEERAKKCMESVKKYLNTDFGVKLSAPGYNKFDDVIGGVTTYPPGAKENGGVFLHTNPWVMIASTQLGDGDLAMRFYKQINPAAKNDIIERYEAEPYCYPQNILGDEHPQFGLARNTWLSGTSSWTYVASTQFIIGVRPEINGLRIDPCVPKAWDGFTVTRKFRGAEYVITVKNPSHVSKGVKEFMVDGKKIEGNVAPVFTAGKHTVDVVMG
jgi:cellobiose phosphorylase